MTKCDVKFYFYIKYINKASAGGIRSMCTYSDTHIYMCAGLKHTNRHTVHPTKYRRKKQIDGSCSHW